MPFGFQYWLVYLPDMQPESFLLFTHRPDGATQLRDYSQRREVKLGQPGAASVYQTTQEGKTRFFREPHKTTDVGYWYYETMAVNRRISPVQATPVESSLPVPVVKVARACPSGRATAGSRLQLQDYVNDHSSTISRAIIDRIRLGSSASIQWVSPLASDNYREYRDSDFLSLVGLKGASASLRAFWPNNGPCWDALGIIQDPTGELDNVPVLVEAKSYRSEVYGNGCKAENPRSVNLIGKALDEAKRFFGADLTSDWMGCLYQSGNRLAHLYFFLQHLHRSAWLVNVYFADDPIGPTSIGQWEAENSKVRDALGLHSTIPNFLEIFLPAIAKSIAPGIGPGSTNGRVPVGITTADFASWRDRWTALGSYQGVSLPDFDTRKRELIELWQSPIPGTWKRGLDPQLLGERYRRGDRLNPHLGEHKIEHEILCEFFPDVTVLDGKLIDGINAMPLTTDAAGGRAANVEADLFLLVKHGAQYRLVIAEVKDRAEHPWCATVQSLRQLRLVLESHEARGLFHRRNPELCLPTDLPVTAIILASLSYYLSPGQKSQSTLYAQELVCKMCRQKDCDIRLAVWTRQWRRIDELQGLP